MPDRGTSIIASARPEALLQTLAEAALAVPGVVRLEPTLSTSGPGRLLKPSPTDGIRLLVRAGHAEVDVNIATNAAYPARTVTHQIRTEVAAQLASHGYPHSSITISVLTITAI